MECNASVHRCQSLRFVSVDRRPVSGTGDVVQYAQEVLRDDSRSLVRLTSSAQLDLDDADFFNFIRARKKEQTQPKSVVQKRSRSTSKSSRTATPQTTARRKRSRAGEPLFEKQIAEWTEFIEHSQKRVLANRQELQTWISGQNFRSAWDRNAQIPPMPEEEQAFARQGRHANLRDVLNLGHGTRFCK